MSNIIIADHNRLLREMLTKAINAEDELKIVQILNSYSGLYEQVKKQDVDWLIISIPDNQDKVPSDIKQIWLDYPDIGVLIVSPDGSHMKARWLEAHEQVLDGINLEKLIELLSNRIDFAVETGK